MELGAIIDALYESEINCTISTFWDGGFIVRLGDQMSGFVAETQCQTSREAAKFLDREARHHYPQSSYAIGKDKRSHLHRTKGLSIVKPETGE